MADLIATNVAVTLDPRDLDYSGQALTKSYPSIAFGDGALTYPANGVPLPDKGEFGMKKAIKRVFIQPPLNGYIYKYDKTNHTIRIYQSAGFTPAGTNANDGPPETFTGTAVAAAPLVELGNVAVAATTLDLEVIGQ